VLLLITLLQGLAKAFRYWQPILLLVVVQLLLAWMMAWPLAVEMHARWDHSTITENLDKLPAMRGMVLDELLSAEKESLDRNLSPLFTSLTGVVYILFSMLALAGILPLYVGLDLKFNWDRFWVNASRYFRPFIGLAIIAALLFWAADLASGVLNTLVNEALAGSDDEFSIFVTGVVVTAGFRFLMFALIVLVFQYAKVIAAAEGLRNIIYLVRKGLWFVSRHFVIALMLFSLLGLIEFGVTALDAAVWYYVLPGADGIVGWIWLALVSFLLVGVKLSFFSSQLLYYVEATRRASDGVRVELDTGSYEPAL
jgi:hypothetical protein